MGKMIRYGLLFGAMLTLAGCSRPQESKKAETPPPAAPVYYQVDPQTAGTLTGKVLFTGKKPERRKIDMDEDPQCAAQHHAAVFDQSLVVNRNGTLSDVFVYVKQGLEGKTFQPPERAVTIDQKGCWFYPRVIGIQTGQPLTVTNSDPVTHNIHPRPRVNREWNQSQAQGADPLTRRFTHPEVMIRVKCNIHSWMHAWIGVVDSPYFAVTGADGTFELKNVPPGQYTIEAWQERLGPQEQPVTLGPSGRNAITFTFKGE